MLLVLLQCIYIILKGINQFIDLIEFCKSFYFIFRWNRNVFIPKNVVIDILTFSDSSYTGF